MENKKLFTQKLIYISHKIKSIYYGSFYRISKSAYFAKSRLKAKIYKNKLISALLLGKNKKTAAGLIFVFIVCFFVINLAYSKQNVDIYIDGQLQSHCYISYNETVADVLSKTDIDISYNDYIYPSLNDTIGENGRIDIYQPVDLTIEYNNQAYRISTPLTGIDAVKQAGILVDDDDIINTSETSNILKVYTIDTTKTSQIIDIKHDTQTIKNKNKYVDYKKIITQGADGKALALITTTYINGAVSNTEQKISKLISAPVTEVVEIGTKQRPNTVSTPLGYKVFTKSYVANISAYCPCVICCGKTNGITASGAKATQYYTIAAPKNIPFGTKVYIPYFKNAPNKGIFVVQDRGGAIDSNRMDVFFNTHQQALNFGRKYLEIYILE